jgi:hypothetical protein
VVSFTNPLEKPIESISECPNVREELASPKVLLLASKGHSKLKWFTKQVKYSYRNETREKDERFCES